jgi:hypothetical protein
MSKTQDSGPVVTDNTNPVTMTPKQVQRILNDTDTCYCCIAERLGHDERLFGLNVPGRPDLERLKKRLLESGGAWFQRGDILATELTPQIVKELLKHGKRFSGADTELVPMDPVDCDANVVLLSLLQSTETWTGLALSDEGFWRLHSWGFGRGKVLETTNRHLEYFGIRVPISYWGRQRL